MITFYYKYGNIIIGDSVKKNNEDKMKDILEELEEEMNDKLSDDKNEEIDVSEQEIIEDNIGETEEELEEIIENTEENVDPFLEEENETDLEEYLEEEVDNDKEFVIKNTITDSDIKKIGDYLIEKLLKYKYIIGLDFAIFLLLFFLIPTIIFEVKPYIWMTLFIVFTILPTMAFYVKNKFKDRQIMFGLIFFYLCILSILDHCTINDLYGITSNGKLDYTPAFIDATFVTFIIVFFQYIGILITNLTKKIRKKKTKK